MPTCKMPDLISASMKLCSWNTDHNKSCVQLPTYADNVALPTFAHRTSLQQQSPARRAGPQTRHSCGRMMGRKDGETDRQKDARQFHRPCSAYYASSGNNVKQQEAQLSPMDRAMRRVSWNLANCHTTVQKLLVRQVLHQVSAVANWPVRRNRAVDSAWRFVR